MITEPYTTTRIWKKTLRKLRLIAAMMGTSMVAVIDQLADAKLRELKDKEEK